MSSAGKSFGTQSPPLDNSGQNEPMGVSNIEGDKPKAVPDSEQRKGYFPGQQNESGKDAQASSKNEK
ncbi:hypothetical protein BDW22DRAFT_1429666 [Trametopsis cervina]|nr:hypothetical protein BDW22DRAFT_1429666 [Trametopsis cervina]